MWDNKSGDKNDEITSQFWDKKVLRVLHKKHGIKVLIDDDHNSKIESSIMR